MAETTTTITPNLYQLGQEIGGDVGWRMVGPDVDGVCIIRTDDVAQDVLDAAVKAHTPDETIQPPPAAPEPDPLDEVRAKVAKITTAATRDALTALLDALS